ncbi:unnamed protein product [Brassica napus]|nr:unnamed protein product [Brassica napus]
MQCWWCAESVYYSRHANEEIKSCKNLQQMEFTPGRIHLLPYPILETFSLKILSFNFLEASYSDILGFGIHFIVGVHPNTILSRIKKTTQTTMMHRSSWEEKKS